MPRHRAWFGAGGAVGLTLFAVAGGVSAESPAADFDLDHVSRSGDRLVALDAAGTEVPLTLDPELQQAATKILASANARRGGMVVIDARSSEVLVWAEAARDGLTRHTIATARMPAASVFKLVTTAALFETTALTPRDRVCISGGAHGIERRHLDPPRGAEARECSPFASALGYSKNAVFAQLATHYLSRNALIETAQALGFNGRVPFELPAPVGRLDVPYGDLEFARAAAGFRGSTLSPLGAAYLASVIAHDGRAQTLRITRASDVGDETATGSDADADTAAAPRAVSARTADRLRGMMEVTTRLGTCRHVFTDEHGRPYLGSIRVAAKTGTLWPEAAEGMTSWFVGFAPSSKPELIVSVLLENGATWRRKANELARDLLRHYFHGHGRPWVTDPLQAPEPVRVVTADRAH